MRRDRFVEKSHSFLKVLAGTEVSKEGFERNINNEYMATEKMLPVVVIGRVIS